MRRLFAWFLTALLLWAACPAFALKVPDIPADAESADLSALKRLSDSNAEALAKELLNYPALKSCDLSGVQLSLKASAALTEACPDILFHFMLDLEGHRLDSFLTELDLDALTDSRGAPLSRKLKALQLRRLLTCMPYLKSISVVESRILLKDMEPIIADFPDVAFDWTVHADSVNYGWDSENRKYFEPMAFRPGATAFSTRKGRQDPRYTAKDLEPVVRYCPDLLALDVGHNNVSDLSFLSAFPKLRRLIVIDSKVPVTDISPLADLNDLEYVELFMQNITDISALAGKVRLLDLNLCHNDITDLTPLHSCVNLERLWISYNKNLPQEEIDRLQEALPNLRVETKERESTGAGWREHPRYFIMSRSFITGIYEPFETEQENP